MPEEDIRNVPLAEIELFVNQSRESFDEAELRQLGDNIKVNGQLQAAVGWLDPGRKRLVLICGERRYRAMKMAGLPTIAMKIIHGPLTPGQMLQINLSENLQRSSLNAIERGKAFRRLMQLEDLNTSEVALRMNVSIATVSRDLSLLDLPESLQARVVSGKLPTSVASAIARIDDDETRRDFADQYAEGRLNRDGVAAAVSTLLNPKPDTGKTPRVSLKACGLSLSVSGKGDKLTIANLAMVLDRASKAAQKLKDSGKTDIRELVQMLKA
jgi:ParB family transcriptional regulator, chromosome partitioning protein